MTFSNSTSTESVSTHTDPIPTPRVRKVTRPYNWARLTFSLVPEFFCVVWLHPLCKKRKSCAATTTIELWAPRTVAALIDRGCCCAESRLLLLLYFSGCFRRESAKTIWCSRRSRPRGGWVRGREGERAPLSHPSEQSDGSTEEKNQLPERNKDGQTCSSGAMMQAERKNRQRRWWDESTGGKKMFSQGRREPRGCMFEDSATVCVVGLFIKIVLWRSFEPTKPISCFAKK